MKVIFILTIIFLLSFLVSSHSFTCQFDHLNEDLHWQSRQALPDQSTVPLNSHAEGRSLLSITRNSIRITLDKSNFTTITAGKNGASTTTSANLAFVLRAMEVSVAFYMNRLKVYPLTIIKAPILCSDYYTTYNDQYYGIGASDLHIYVLYSTDKNLAYGATGKSCKYFGDGLGSTPDNTLQLGRPTVGRIIFNTYSLIDTAPSLSNRLFQSITATALHQNMHILGFDSTLYPTYLDSDSTSATYAYNYPTTTVSMAVHASRPSTVGLATPNVLSWAKQFFNCPTLTAMPLQNQDATPIGSHWQRVAVYDELMTATSFASSIKGFSALTLALLRDMGWYTVDSSFNQTTNYGYHKGCPFVLNACYSTSFTEFCNSATQSNILSCTTDFLSKSLCTSDAATLADGCGIQFPVANSDCMDPSATSQAYKSYTLESYSTSSFCFGATLGSVALPNTLISRCYSYTCNSNSIVLTIGSSTITCLSNEGGTPKTLSGFTGQLTCPDFSSVCTIGRKPCLNWCSQNGYCMGGICNCISGYYGEDCSKTICTNSTFYNPLTLSCVSTCPSGYYQNFYSSTCAKCSSTCQQCFSEPAICTGCISSSTDPQYFYNSICYSTCPTGTYTNGFNCSICDSSVFCSTCSVSSTNCTSCGVNPGTSAQTYLSQPSFGSCIASCPISGSYSITDVVNFVCVNTCNDNLVLIGSTCNFCQGGNYKFISNNTCLAACPDYYYANNITWICANCDSSCLKCAGGYAQNCTACSPTSTLRYLLLNMCWATCPGGYYSNSTDGKCYLCPQSLNCGNCTIVNATSTVQCTSCAYSYYFQVSTSTCSSSCAGNQYGNNGNNSCMGCDPSCTTCSGPGASFCTTCPIGKFYIANITGGYCIDACNPIGYTSSGSNCLACDPSCYTCIGSSPSQCLSCFNGTYLSSQYCRYVCPPATYQDSVLNKCMACDGSCTYCFGSTINNCTGCISGMVLYNFTCTLTCPAGYTVNQWKVCSQSQLLISLIWLAACLLFLS